MAFQYSVVKDEKYGDPVILMPNDALIEQRIQENREKNSRISQEMSEFRSKNSFSSGEHKKSKFNSKQSGHHQMVSNHGGNGGSKTGHLFLRKTDLRIFDKFYDMLKQYNYEDAQAMVEAILNRLKEDEEMEQGDDMSDHDEEIEEANDDSEGYEDPE